MIYQRYHCIIKDFSSVLRLIINIISKSGKIPFKTNISKTSHGEYIVQLYFLFSEEYIEDVDKVESIVIKTYGYNDKFLHYKAGDLFTFREQELISVFSTNDNRDIEKRISFTLPETITPKEALAILNYIIESLGETPFKYIRLIMYDDIRFQLVFPDDPTLVTRLKIRDIHNIREIAANLIHQGLAPNLRSTELFATSKFP